jgi:hypothetical protein
MANQSKPKRARVPVPAGEMEQHLERQLWLLEKSCLSYDGGDRDEFARIATSIRVLCYDHGQSRSILGQLNMKGSTFVSYAGPVNSANLLADSPLTMWRIDSAGGSTEPILDRGFHAPRDLTFEAWWNEAAVRLSDDERLSRGELVLIAANQAGGAHVDPDLDAVFHRIANQNEAGVFTQGPDGQITQLADMEKAAIRQIGFELLNSVQAELAKRIGNNGCSCGSGRKHRYCCGKKPASA